MSDDLDVEPYASPAGGFEILTYPQRITERAGRDVA